jgi:molybdate transport system ATP-binding protein
MAAVESPLPPAPLVELREAVLAYPGSSPSSKLATTRPLNLAILPASSGGHALIGANASGKTLISNSIASHGSADYLQSGAFETDKPWYSNTVARASFESHEEILAAGGSVTKVISRGGNPNKAAQFLIVRFGLFPLLHREVGTLSTGEIRKVMLVRALADRPRLLILDNAFDGLDVPSRETLKDLVARTIQGFRPDILVQAVSASSTAHTQVLLLTHRPEEVVDEIAHISVFRPDLCQGDDIGETGQVLDSFPRESLSSQEVFHKAMGIGLLDGSNIDPWDDTSLPTCDEITAVWQGAPVVKPGEPLVVAKDLHIRRGNATLLHGLNWEVQAGERWLVAGGNGAGKSTLSRLLAMSEGGLDGGHLDVNVDSVMGVVEDGSLSRSGVGWVSTERHMKTSKSHRSAREFLNSNGAAPQEVTTAVAGWMQIDESLLQRPFYQLSQGQQKMILLASAIASRPLLLVLDEPVQGLDLLARQRLLGLVERICQATNLSLVYITHHLEELIPSVTHVIHLAEGRDVYQGSKVGYNPEAASSSATASFRSEDFV